LLDVSLSATRGSGVVDGIVQWLGARGRDVAGVMAPAHPQITLAVGLVQLASDVASAVRDDERPCTSADTRPRVPTDGRRIVVLVGGLGSTSSEAGIERLDTAELGYAREDVVRFSYRGGRVPDPTDRLSALPARAYAARHTEADLAASARLLAELIEDVAVAAPSTTIDVIGHSQGGVVARLAIDELSRNGRLPDTVDLVVTIASPHSGAPLAALAVHATDTPLGELALGLLDAVTALPTGRAALAQLAPESSVLVSSAISTDVRWLSIASRSDVIVPAPMAELAGAAGVVVGVDGVDAHHSVLESADVIDEIELAIAGLPPRCEPRAERVVDAVVGRSIALGEELLLSTLGSFP
jgi:pimeloyl-ACP methyl ester carboxylesterase